MTDTCEKHCEATAFKIVIRGLEGEVARLKEQLAQPEQEPVATLEDLEQEIYQNTRNFVSRDVMEWMLKRYYTHPPQRTEQEPVAWRNAAIRVGEDLSSVGPDGYYDMTAQQWLDWAMEQQPHGKNSLAQPAQPPQRTEQNFCSRCGKRTKDIHTCTPPKD